MDLGFRRLEEEKAAAAMANPLVYGDLVAGLDAIQAMSHVAAVEQSIAHGRFNRLPHVGAMANLFETGADWTYAIENLDGSFHSEMAKHLNDLRE